MSRPPGPSSFPGQSSCSSVISPQYCSPHQMILKIAKKAKVFSSYFEITSSAGSDIRFKVKNANGLAFLTQRRHLLDSAGVPIITLQVKSMSLHRRWQAFRGNSNDKSDLMFSVKTASVLYFKMKLHVFLAHNTQENTCDFRVECSWSEKSCKIYIGESSTVIAEMHKKTPTWGFFTGNENYEVVVYPNVDYLFIGALIVILDEMCQSNAGGGGGGGD